MALDEASERSEGEGELEKGEKEEKEEKEKKEKKKKKEETTMILAPSH